VSATEGRPSNISVNVLVTFNPLVTIAALIWSGLSSSLSNAGAAIGGGGGGVVIGTDDVAFGAGLPPHPATRVQAARAPAHVDLFM
jgi:hypothetical protein